MKGAAEKSGVSYTELSGSSRHICFGDLVSIVRRIRSERYDVVLVFGIRVSLLMRFLKPFFSRPLITCLRGLDKWRKWYHIWSDRITESGVDLFISNSRAVSDMRASREGTKSDKLVVIENGIDVDYFDREKAVERVEVAEGKVIVSTIANFRIQKGYDFLIEVLDKFRDDFLNCHFLWAGKGPLQAETEARLTEIGLREKVTFLGHVEDVRPVLVSSDIFVLPSREEGMPRCLMEAMSMELPCVATAVGGTVEVIEDGVSGYLSEFGDVDSMGMRIRELVYGAELRRTVGQKGRARIIRKFTMHSIAGKYAALFKMVSVGDRSAVHIQEAIADVCGV
jgi:glycosyltransferase involved in cell wall biosynthesis